MRTYHVNYNDYTATHPYTTSDDIAKVREWLMDHEFYPACAKNTPEEVLVDKAGWILRQMIYIHNDLGVSISTNHEIWMIAEFLFNKRGFWNVVRAKSYGYGSRPLASFLGNKIYDWCKYHPELSEIDRRTILLMLEER